MPPAAIPIAGAAASTVGSLISSKASQPKNIPAPAPNALFPSQQSAYLNELSRSGVGKTSFSTIGEAAKTGLPTDQSPFFGALRDSMGRAKSQDEAALIEKFGSHGLGSGSDLLKAGTDYELQSGKDFATILADYTRQASESAANRKLQASTIGATLAGEPGLAETPSSTLVTGSPSAAGSGLSAVGQGVNQLLIMKQLYPDLFSSSKNGGGVDGASGNAIGA